MEFPPRIQALLNEEYTVNIGEYFSAGINLYQRNIGGFAGYTALFGLAMLVGGIIPFLGGLALIAIFYPMYMGYYLTAAAIDRGERPDFAYFFKGFDFIAPLLLCYLVSSLLTSIAFLPIGALMGVAFLSGANDLSVTVLLAASAVLFVPMIYLSIAWRWAPLFIIFHQLNFWEAMEASRRLTSQHWFHWLGFAFLIGLMAMFGMLGLVFGLLFTVPMALCIDYVAFADVTQLNATNSPEDDLVDHFIA